MSNKPVMKLGVPAIEMQGVTIGTMKDPGLTVASNVNWTVKAGEFWVVAGALRSGKTDFFMTTGGLLPPAQGTYRFFGEEMPIFDDAQLVERLKLGLVFDGGQLFNQMTIAENVSLPMRYHHEWAGGDVEAQTSALLTAVELESLANSRPASIGRGLQQRAGLARALALRPEMLLLDNPLSGLDALHANWWLGFLDELSRGHAVMGGKPLTIVATADDLRPWRGERRQFACLANERLAVIGDWAALEKSNDDAVLNLLYERGVVRAGM